MKPKTAQRKGPGETSRHRKWPPEVRLQVAQAVVERGTSAVTLSQAFGIPVSTVMDWAMRYRRCGSDPKRFASEPWRQRKETVARGRTLDPRREAVVQARRDHPEHGTRRIRDVMARFQGLGISETTVRRILHEEGIVPQAPKKAVSRA